MNARRRTVYRCRILPADDSVASKSCQEFKSDKNFAKLSTDFVNSTTTRSNADTVSVNATSITAASHFRTPVGISSDDFSCGNVDQSSSDKSDEVAAGFSTTQCRNELLSVDTVNTTVIAEGNTCQQAASINCRGFHGADSHVASDDSSAQNTSSRDMGGINTCMGCRKSTGDHEDYSDAAAVNSSGRLLFQPSVPAQECVHHRLFASTATFIVGDKSDTGRDTAAERNVRAAGLRSDFDAHAQLKCVPLKLVSQLDGAVPDSESEASDEEADIPVGCDDGFSRSLAAPRCRQFAVDRGATCSPFKCVKCKRIYRTEESCALHSAMCTFEVSSSSESEKSDCDGDLALDPSDQDTESGCSDDADDGIISEYLNSSRNSENAANCLSLGCQTENIFLSPEDCDVNANCKMLCHSNVKTDHLRCGTTGSDSVTSGIENAVNEQDCDLLTESRTEMLHYSQKTVAEAAVTCSESIVVGSKEISADSACALDFAVQAKESVDNELSGGAKEHTDGQLPEPNSLERGNSACFSPAYVSVDSRVTWQPPVCGHDSVQCSGAGMLHSQVCCGIGNSRKDVPVTSVQAVLCAGDSRVDSNHIESKPAERIFANDKPLMGLSRVEANAVSIINLAGEPMLPLIDSSKTSAYGTGYDTVEHFSSCAGTSYHPGLNASLCTLSSSANIPRCVTYSSSACVSSPQRAVKLQDILTSSATMVWPSATVYPSIVNNRSVSSVAAPSGMCPRLLGAPCGSLTVLTTASVVIPTALPNAVAAVCIRPLNVAHPLYGIGHRPVLSSSHGQVVQQFLHPMLVAPVAFLAPQVAVMNAVHPCQPLLHHPAVTSTCSSLCVSSQQSASSVPVSDVRSASPRLMLSQYLSSVSKHSSFIPQKSVNNADFAGRMTPVYSQSSSLRLPWVATTSLPPGYLQSSSRADVSSHHVMSTAAVSRLICPQLSVAAVPPLHSSSLNTNSVSINQLHNPPAPMHHVAAPLALSKYVVSSAGMFFTWSTGTTPATVSSLSSSTCGHNKSLSAGKSGYQAAVANREAETNLNVAPLVGNPSCLTNAAPRFNGMWPVHNVASTAHCPDLMLQRATSAVSLSVSGAGDMYVTTGPRCVTSSSASSPVAISSCRSSSNCSLNSLYIGTKSTAAKGLLVAGSSAKSPRLIIQPSFIPVTTRPEASTNVVQSVYTTQVTSVPHSSVQHLLTHSNALSYANEVSAAEFSPAYSALNKSISTFSSPANRPLLRIVSSAECLSCPVNPQLFSSPPISTETKASSGK